MSYYQPKEPNNMQFYQSNFNQSFGQATNLNKGSNTSFGMGNMNSGFGTNLDVTGQMGNIKLPPGLLAAFGTSGYPGEPSLLEELGINFSHIKQKTLAVLNPFNVVTPELMADSDLAGPIIFVLLFGVLLFLAGKVQFGYIYGVGLFGTASLHFLFKLMSDETSIELSKTASVIGYCMLPLVLVSVFGVFIKLENSFGFALSCLAVWWCTFSASGFLVVALKLRNMRPLIAYPLAMFYAVFALMAIFVEKSDVTSRVA